MLKKNARILLYSVLIVEILISSSIGFSWAGRILFGILVVAGTSGMVSNWIFRRQRQIWSDVRIKLQQVLIANSIIPGAPELEPPKDYPSRVIMGDTIQDLSIQINPHLIEKLRSLGLDGILISLYLLKHRGSYASIKAIQKNLNIPSSTLYRNIQKLEDQNFIVSKSGLDNPGRSFYRIAYDGEILMFDFYDLLNISAVDPLTQTIDHDVSRSQDNLQFQAKQVIPIRTRNKCQVCRAKNKDTAVFCGECGTHLRE